MIGEEGISAGASDQLCRRFVVELLVFGFDNRRPTALFPPMTRFEVSNEGWAQAVVTKAVCNERQGDTDEG